MRLSAVITAPSLGHRGQREPDLMALRTGLRQKSTAPGFRREFGERALANWGQRRKEMRLNLLITLLALALATVAAQSPLF